MGQNEGQAMTASTAAPAKKLSKGEKIRATQKRAAELMAARQALDRDSEEEGEDNWQGGEGGVVGQDDGDVVMGGV